jgi:hypothetical protein
MSDFDPERIEEEDEIEEWEQEWIKQAVAPYLDDNGDFDIEKLRADCSPLDDDMQKELDDALS